MTTAAATTTVELLHFARQSPRAAQMLAALARTAPLSGVELHEGDAYRGTSDWLLLWGPGGPDRVEPMRQQLAAGGHVVALDLAYWSRQTKVRVTIDAPHPQAWVMRQTRSPLRFLADPVAIGSAWNPKGPVIVAGVGPKAAAQYGETVARWERTMIDACRARGCRVRYRRKSWRAPVPSGVTLTSDAPIERVLRDASLLITWHSNVAIDALRLGIPVVCRDGAAATICPATLPDELRPLSIAVRTQFLHNLAWWQWAPQEAAACWAFLQAGVA